MTHSVGHRLLKPPENPEPFAADDIDHRRIRGRGGHWRFNESAASRHGLQVSLICGNWHEQYFNDAAASHCGSPLAGVTADAGDTLLQ